MTRSRRRRAPGAGIGILRKPFKMNELWYAVNQALAAPPAAER